MQKLLFAARAALLIVSGTGWAVAEDLPPLEAYATLPELSLATLSPSGQRVAMRVITEGRDYISVFDLGSGQPVNAMRADNINPRLISFVSERSLILTVGETKRSLSVRSSFDYSGAIHYNLKIDEVAVMLKGAPDIYEYQTGLGRIVGLDPDGAKAYMPAFLKRGGSGNSIYGLYEYEFKSGKSRLLQPGTQHTRDWFVDSAGNPIAREDYNQETDMHEIWRYRDGKAANLLLSLQTPIPVIEVVGLSPDYQSLVLVGWEGDMDGNKLYLMDIDSGEVVDSGMGRDDTTISQVICRKDRVVLGVRFAGLMPRYRFFDGELSHRIEHIQQKLPGNAMHLEGWSHDYTRLLFFVAGELTSGAYVSFDGVVGPSIVGQARPAIQKTIKVNVEEYPAQDGLTIPALVTAKPDVLQTGTAPLIVMPHGGPEANDEFGFDWMAQYFASRGYVVLQPQFRGSTGFGVGFTKKGLGEWGRAMSTDLDDGVKYLADKGVVDPERVCIVGASYGGYAALAAGAFSPELYRCVVSIAGISDLYDILMSERQQRGRSAWTLDYWQAQFGAGFGDRDTLRQRSPAEHAEAFRAPVLLIHGRDDTVVRYHQSKTMERALKKAGKPVELQLLKGEDHWLTHAETRLETLRLVDAFISKHLH